MRRAKQGKRPTLPVGVLSYREAARRLGISEPGVHDLCRRKLIARTYRYGGADASYRRACGVRAADVEKLVAVLKGRQPQESDGFPSRKPPVA